MSPNRRDGWRKSTRSNNSGNGQDCVEARATGAAFEVRDSKLGEQSPIFDLSSSDFAALLDHGRRNG
ncbi:DUF397 domain-containing protein [Glycomyces sp. NPDC048151]|uniref:DUF397 domain-containing protein n=1 Tax=Glycomyces sp. NPDC048151 TaxID=3364002 RepID=UPI00371D8C67